MTTADTPPQSLPEVVQLAMQNRRDIAALIETVNTMAERLTAAHERMVQTLTSLIQEDRGHIAVLTTGLSELPLKIESMATNVESLTGKVGRLTGAQQQTNDRLTEMNGHLTTRSGRVANLSGDRFEKEVTRLATRISRRQLNLADATVTHIGWDFTTIAVSDIADLDGITDSEAEDLNRADLIITGHDDAGHTVHVVAEISGTIESTDITRSDRRAAILQKATGQTVRAVAIGNEAAPEAIALAGSQQVNILTMPTPANDD
ncbi:MAG: hypothetical protein J4G13_07325 [Dehalococcoidia bacterium]|nr:hypothetical protein [Dehalococcoidia bacterium]